MAWGGLPLRMWDNVISGLVSKFYVVTFDIRGAGKSLNFDDNEDVFSFEKYSEDLNYLLRHLKIGKFNLEYGLGYKSCFGLFFSAF